jgi:hypothetical protein
VEARTLFELFVISVNNRQVIGQATLTCDPPGGSHPYAAKACEQLSQANGHIEEIPEDPGPCPLIFDPVVATAVGVWRGEPRTFAQQYGNSCAAIRATGGVVFNFFPAPGIESSD